jgi:hypothetical protein
MISISGAMVWKIKSKRIWSFQRQYFREQWHYQQILHAYLIASMA